MFTTNSGRFISYYGREHTLDIQRQDGNNPTISTIDQLFNVILTTLIISKKPGNTGISRDIRTEFTTDLLLSD